MKLLIVLMCAFSFSSFADHGVHPTGKSDGSDCGPRVVTKGGTVQTPATVEENAVNGEG